MGALSTHVLDTSAGKPAAGVRLELYHLGADRTLLSSAVTNANGRVDRPLLQGEAFQRGEYEIIFHAGEYFARQGLSLPDPPFLDRVAIRFGVADAGQNYHLPLLISPWSYSTYRGS